jgi:salicylate hydroxylase
MLGWKGNVLAQMDFYEYANELGTPFWDFHRANLHAALLERAMQLGAKVVVGACVVDVEFVDVEDDGKGSVATTVLEDGRTFTADLVVGADGINRQMSRNSTWPS